MVPFKISVAKSDLGFCTLDAAFHETCLRRHLPGRWQRRGRTSSRLRGDELDRRIVNNDPERLRRQIMEQRRMVSGKTKVRPLLPSTISDRSMLSCVIGRSHGSKDRHIWQQHCSVLITWVATSSEQQGDFLRMFV